MLSTISFNDPHVAASWVRESRASHKRTQRRAVEWDSRSAAVRRRGCVGALGSRPARMRVRRPWAAAVGVQCCTAPPPAPRCLFSATATGGARHSASRPRDALQNARVCQVTDQCERCIRYRTSLKRLVRVRVYRRLASSRRHERRVRAEGSWKMHFPAGARRRRCGAGGCMRWWTSYWFLSGRSSLIVSVQGAPSIVAPGPSINPARFGHPVPRTVLRCSDRVNAQVVN